MDIIKFRSSEDARKNASEEAENKQQDQRLAEEFRATAKELEAKALARQPQTELPEKDARAMLDRMLAQIHADPELDKRAKALVETPEPEKESAADEQEMEELIQLGRALKDSGKTLEDIIGKEAAPSSKEKEHKKKRRRWKKSARIFMGAAASAAVVLIVSINSNAMRMYWVEKLGWLLGNKPVTTVDNEEHFVEGREYSEIEALDLIKDELGIRPVYFIDIPEGMKYDGVYIDKQSQWAKIFYTYKNKMIITLMDKSDKDMSLGITYDGNAFDSEEKDLNSIKILLRKIQRDTENTGYYAEAEYGNVFYQITGDIEESEFYKLIEGIEFW